MLVNHKFGRAPTKLILLTLTVVQYNDSRDVIYLPVSHRVSDTRYIDLFLESAPEPVRAEDSVATAQQLIAQAHGLTPPVPRSQPTSEPPQTLAAQQIIGQAHGMAAQGGYPSAAPDSTGYEQSAGAWPQPPQPAAAAPAGPPVRKRLMAGIVRPVDTGMKRHFQLNLMM